MYNINKKEDALKEVQKYLAGIEYIERPPSPTGVYDDKTREGVLMVQRKAGIPESGTVDIVTMELIYGEYLYYKTVDRARQRSGGLDFPVSLGDSGDGIREINDALIFLMEYYGESHRIKRNSYFGEPSSRASEYLSLLYGLDERSEIDEILYMRMYEDVEAIKRINNFKES